MLTDSGIEEVRVLPKMGVSTILDIDMKSGEFYRLALI